MRTGVANLPLHYGKAPAWLFKRMVRLARQITLVIVAEHSPREFLNRVSDPFWFQAFGCVLGFDWHSSGLTTTLCGALKEGLKDISKDIGIFVCGGKGSVSRKTPHEIEEVGLRRLVNANTEGLIYASKMSAKVDSCALQDGYQLYQHSFIFSKSGDWAVIQQGMNTSTRWARRYHWLGKEVSEFVCEPHKAICCDHTSQVFNMTAKESGECRKMSTVLATESPEKVTNEFVKLKRLSLSSRHSVSMTDIRPRNLEKILLKTYERMPDSFEKLLGIEGVGPKTIRALSLISELIYGKSVSYRDPVRFSFAHGGKDGHPYPVNKKQYDLSIQILKDAVNKSKIGRHEKLEALKRMNKNYGKGS
ncbi:MAG: DUF763 domain-containing protein [Candidatus Omnitrophica bacterium]|nr:DUF763 domain-containing protein [Candidatus Omnitrophota bacterium]